MTSVKDLAGAVALGLGAIFGGRRADQHWSERPGPALEEEAGDASGDDLDQPAMVALERRLARAEVALGLAHDQVVLDGLDRASSEAVLKDREGRVAALLDARRELRRGHDPRMAVGLVVASWDVAVRDAHRQGRQWLAFRWAGAEEVAALAAELAALDVAVDDAG